ncbi:MAG TPA: NfeD family protein [Candidatus Cloacimonadota bacterium]|nr:NfeD family protein [Candidatus Cloacimonadota bacterium]
MMQLLAWHVWIIIGIAFVIIEIFDPAFFFISLGIGAIATGLLALLPVIDRSIPVQILLFAIVSFISFLFMRKLGKKVLANPGADTNVYALKGKTGHVTQAIKDDGRGYVKVGGEEWVAVSENGESIAEQAKVVITGIEGNKLIVRQM